MTRHFMLIGAAALLSFDLAAAPLCEGNCQLGPSVQVGSNGQGDGRLTLLAGDEWRAPNLGAIGAFGTSRGSLTLSGTGARLATGGGGNSAFWIGHGGGRGDALVEDAALLSVEARDAGPGNFGDARLYVGRGGLGELLLRSGGQVVVNDPGGWGADDDIMIGRSEGALTGTGRIGVETGAQLLLRGNAAYLNVGNANLTFAGTAPGNGLLHIRQGGRVLVEGTTGQGGLHVGRGDLSRGEVIVEGAGSLLSLDGRYATAYVANAFSATTHTGSGYGVLRVRDGGLMRVQQDEAVAGGNWTSMVIGLGLGEGVVEVGNGGRIELEADLRISNNLGNDKLQTGRLILEEGGVLQARRIYLGNGDDSRTSAWLQGTGLLQGDLQVLAGGVVMPGFSPGRLQVQGDVQFQGGGLVAEFGGTGPGQSDRLDVSGQIGFTAGSFIELVFTNGYLPRLGDRLDIVQAQAVEGLALAQLRFSGVATGFEASLQWQDGRLGWLALNDAQPVPEPATLWLLLGGGLLLHRRGRVARKHSGR